MRQNSIIIALIVILAVVLTLKWAFAAEPINSPFVEEPTNLAIVWTSADPDVAHRMTLMYTNASKKNKWFEEVELIVWGPSQKLLVDDEAIQREIAKLKDAGVTVRACLACADMYGIAEDLRALGLEVIYMGEPLSDFIKSPDWAVITF